MSPQHLEWLPNMLCSVKSVISDFLPTISFSLYTLRWLPAASGAGSSTDATWDETTSGSWTLRSR